MNKELSILLEEIGKKAKSASAILNTATRDQKNKFFDFAISSIQENANAILAANHIDIKAAQENNKDEAFNIVQNESKIIQETYSNRASNNSVKSSFNNNFLAEVQKGIFKVNNRVSTNIIQTLDNEVSVKRNRL